MLVTHSFSGRSRSLGACLIKVHFACNYCFSHVCEDRMGRNPPEAGMGKCNSKQCQLRETNGAFSPPKKGSKASPSRSPFTQGEAFTLPSNSKAGLWA